MKCSVRSAEGFAGFKVSECRTVLGFEQRCFYARTDSAPPLPEVPGVDHTPMTQATWLHLRLRKNSTDRWDLLLSDFPGEYFRRARNSLAEARALPGIGRADKIVLFLDGERVANTQDRYSAFNEVDMLLIAFEDSGAIRTDAEVLLLYSKWDLVIKSGAEHAVEDFQRRVEKKWMSRGRALEFLPVAARGGADLGDFHGLDRLLDWIVKTRESSFE